MNKIQTRTCMHTSNCMHCPLPQGVTPHFGIPPLHLFTRPLNPLPSPPSEPNSSPPVSDHLSPYPPTPGSDPNISDFDGNSCLHLALQAQDTGMVQLLLEKGAKCVSVAGWTDAFAFRITCVVHARTPAARLTSSHSLDCCIPSRLPWPFRCPLSSSSKQGSKDVSNLPPCISIP